MHDQEQETTPAFCLGSRSIVPSRWKVSTNPLENLEANLIGAKRPWRHVRERVDLRRVKW